MGNWSPSNGMNPHNYITLIVHFMCQCVAVKSKVNVQELCEYDAEDELPTNDMCE